jgi:hypothetical protein
MHHYPGVVIQFFKKETKSESALTLRQSAPTGISTLMFDSPTKIHLELVHRARYFVGKILKITPCRNLH